MLSFIKFLLYWFHPTKDAIFTSFLPWHLRWRLLALQPVTLLTYAMKYLPYALSKRYSVIEVPTRGRHTVRAIVFLPKDRQPGRLSPVHLDFHGGVFLGGIAEYDSPFCELLSDRTGAVVIGAQYRRAPAYPYPSAHEDAEDVVDWVLQHAKEFWNADPHTLTVSGSSVGGNLMFTAGRRAKAAVGICPAVDLRLPPWEKPKPTNSPSKDPLSFLMPLFDAYVGPVREQTKADSTLNPILKDHEEVPEHILFIVAGIDILAHEELIFIERLRQNSEPHTKPPGRRFEAIVFDKGFHGWLDLPSWIIDENDRTRAFNAAIEFIASTRKNS